MKARWIECCAVYVQYLSSICTVLVQLNTVQIVRKSWACNGVVMNNNRGIYEATPC